MRALGVTANAPSATATPPPPPPPAASSDDAHSPEARWHRLVGEMLSACAAETKGVAAGNEVLAACVAAREWGLGTRALVEVGKRRLAFDEQTYQHAIAVLAERREGPRAVQLLREMQVRWRWLGKGCWRCCRWHGTRLQWTQVNSSTTTLTHPFHTNPPKIQGRGFSARTAEYNHVMFACLDRNWETALELFRELEAGGPHVPRMDTGTAMAALGACRAGRQWQTAPLVIEAARQREVEPSLLLFNALLGVYAAVQQTDKVCGGGGPQRVLFTHVCMPAC